MGSRLRAEEIHAMEHVGQLRIGAVYEALRRFEADLTTHRITQDGCPVTRTHMMNARKVAKTLNATGWRNPSRTGR